MTRKELQAIYNHVIDTRGLIAETRYCKEHYCSKCNYFDVCEVISLLLKLIANKGG